MTTFFCGQLLAQPNVANEYGLFLSPNLCLLSSQEKTCEITIHIRWQTPEIGDYCLHKSPEQDAIKCWTNNQHGNHQVEFSLDENLTLYILSQSDHKVIYHQTVRLQREAKIYRRSRRNPWRFY